MANEKKKEAVEVVEKKETAKKATTKKAAAPKKEEKKVSFGKASEHDFKVIIAPVITEKTMSLMQNANKVTMRVCAQSNKVELKGAFERIFQVKVTDVKVSNQIAKTTTRGGRYQGQIGGFKKAIFTIADGEAIDLFKE